MSAKVLETRRRIKLKSTYTKKELRLKLVISKGSTVVLLFSYNHCIQHGGRANSLGGSDSSAIYRSALKYILDKYATFAKVIFNGMYTIYMAGVCA
jgi:hypothetical protein